LQGARITAEHAAQKIVELPRPRQRKGMAEREKWRAVEE
jgi:hypothetical protein